MCLLNRKVYSPLILHDRCAFIKLKERKRISNGHWFLKASSNSNLTVKLIYLYVNIIVYLLFFVLGWKWIALNCYAFVPFFEKYFVSLIFFRFVAAALGWLITHSVQLISSSGIVNLWSNTYTEQLVNLGHVFSAEFWFCFLFFKSLSNCKRLECSY